MKRGTIEIIAVGTWLVANTIYLSTSYFRFAVPEPESGQKIDASSSSDSVLRSPDSPLSQRGFCVRSLTDSQGRYRRYVVFVPYDYVSEKPVPGILSFNGFGENGSDGILQVNYGLGLAVWEMKRSFPFLVIFPQCDQNGQWNADGPETQRAMSILKDVCSNYNVGQVFLTGVSAGGTGAWVVAAQYPEKFAGLIPLSSVPDSVTVIAPIVKAKLPVWNYYLDGDKPELVAANRGAVQALLQHGASPHVTEIHDVGHNSWDHAYRDVGLYSWMLSQDLKERFDASGFVPLPLNPFVPDQWQLSEGGRIESLPNNASRLHGTEDANVKLVRLLAADYTAIHLEFRLPQSIPWLELAFAGMDNVEPLVIRVANPMLASSLVSQGAIRLATSAPSTWGAFRQSQWNDLRVRRSQTDVNVTLNGWSLLTAKMATNHSFLSRMEIRLPTGTASVDLRHLRSKLEGLAP
jgi:pimeloyl-ACP methyl ester carboxylesterase